MVMFVKYGWLRSYILKGRSWAEKQRDKRAQINLKIRLVIFYNFNLSIHILRYNICLK